jgi:hypothetical protein
MKGRDQKGSGKIRNLKSRRISSENTLQDAMLLIEKLDRMPPFLCRLMARRNGRSPSNKDLSKDSGIPLTTLRRICEKKTWADVPVGMAQRFSVACGVDLLRQTRSLEYFKRRKFAHIKKSPNLKYYNKLLKLWKET